MLAGGRWLCACSWERPGLGLGSPMSAFGYVFPVVWLLGNSLRAASDHVLGPVRNQLIALTAHLFDVDWGGVVGALEGLE